MSEAPERVWVDPTNNDESGVWFVAGSRPRLAMQDVEYVRADLHSLPDRVRALLRAIVECEPDDMAADGVTVLDVWRKECCNILAAVGRKP